MLFFTTLLIGSFCFVFYLVWNQFLRKDARLSIGLKILQKKMDVLENFSEKIDLQLSKGVELLDKKNRELEKIIGEARFCIFKMEKLTSGMEKTNMEKTNNTPKAAREAASKLNPKKTYKLDPPREGPLPSKENRISLVKDEQKNKKLKSQIDSKEHLRDFDFGESPFSHLNFVEWDEKNDPSPEA